MAERWLRCDVHKGMFSDEMVVVIRTLTGELVSFFVPAEQVIANGQGMVKVRMFKDNAQAWAVVPSENQAVVPVDESQFVSA